MINYRGVFRGEEKGMKLIKHANKRGLQQLGMLLFLINCVHTMYGKKLNILFNFLSRGVKADSSLEITRVTRKFLRPKTQPMR